MTNIKGFFATKSDKTKGVCIKDMITQKKGDWYGGEAVWKYIQDLRWNDPILYRLDDSGRNCIYITKAELDGLDEPNRILDSYIEKDDSVLYDEIQDLKNMVGSLIEDVSLIKQHFGIKKMA